MYMTSGYSYILVRINAPESLILHYFLFYRDITAIINIIIKLLRYYEELAIPVSLSMAK